MCFRRNFHTNEMTTLVKCLKNSLTSKYLGCAVSWFGHMSFENTACNVSHSMKAKLCVFTIPNQKKRWRINYLEHVLVQYIQPSKTMKYPARCSFPGSIRLNKKIRETK